MERKINKIKLYHNKKEKSVVVANSLLKELQKHQFEIVEEGYDLAISIGGDGTFLKAVGENHFNDEIYYVGINTGSLGFMQEIRCEDYLDFIDRLNHNNYEIENLYLQETQIITPNKTYNFTSLNEIVIRNKSLKVFEGQIEIDHELLENFTGDGMLISTPTGSTAYNLSLGGSIIYHSINALIMTPIAPLKNKVYKNLSCSIIIPQYTEITIYPTKKNILITVDGINYEINDVLKLETKIANKKIKKLKIYPSNYIKTINQKLLS